MRFVLVDTFCESDYVQYKGHCYKIQMDKLNWYDAQDECRKEGSKLVSVGSSQEQAFINGKTVTELSVVHV